MRFHARVLTSRLARLILGGFTGLTLVLIVSLAFSLDVPSVLKSNPNRVEASNSAGSMPAYSTLDSLARASESKEPQGLREDLAPKEMVEMEVVVMKSVPTYDATTGEVRWENQPQRLRTYMRP